MPDLRTRIAEAARKANTGAFGNGEADDWYQIADAIIADLGIEPVGTRDNLRRSTIIFRGGEYIGNETLYRMNDGDGGGT